jgi:transcriptional regulator with XRE-family HTH domain
MHLDEARFRRHITQFELALKCGLSQTKISLFEKGFRMPSDDEKKRLAKVLQVKPMDLEFKMIKVSE